MSEDYLPLERSLILYLLKCRRLQLEGWTWKDHGMTKLMPNGIYCLKPHPWVDDNDI